MDNKGSVDRGRNDNVTFYIFDNLRPDIAPGGGGVYRYGDLGQAMDAYRRVRKEYPDWSVALGINIGGPRELDLVQSRGLNDCLITDYRRVPDFNDSPEVLAAVEAVVVGLQIGWQVDHELAGCSILVPQEVDVPEFEEYLEGFILRPSDSRDVLTAVQEVAVVGEGWMDLSELRELSAIEPGGRSNPPKVTGFTVAYEYGEIGSGCTGYVSASSSDFRMMKQAYQEIVKEQEASREACGSAVRDDQRAPQREAFGQSTWREMIAEAKENARAMNEQREDGRAEPNDLEL